MSEPISREEHEEFRRRIEAEDNRQNRRIELLERSVEQSTSLASAVQKLADNMEAMLKEQERQGERLEKLEGRDGDMWRAIVKYAITTVLGILIGYIFVQIGMK